MCVCVCVCVCIIKISIKVDKSNTLNGFKIVIVRSLSKEELNITTKLVVSI